MAVISDVPLSRIGGINAARESAGKDGRVVGDVPLRGVETDDAHRVVSHQAELFVVDTCI